MTTMRILIATALLSTLVACSDSFPATLHETGLYSGDSGETLAEGVRAYAPAFELWADGADKSRYVFLPEGTTIDNSDPEYWVFPVGTKMWKHFDNDGVRIETRLIQKLDEETWGGAAYIWTDRQSVAERAPAGGIRDIDGTHDIPSDAECGACHIPTGEWPMGFNALQLDDPGAPYSLQDLIDEGRLSEPVEHRVTWPDDVTRRALGNLHANCGGCHHPRQAEFSAGLPPWTEPTPDDLDLRITVAELNGNLEDSALFQTNLGVEMGRPSAFDADRIVPGDGENSGIVLRMQSRQFMRSMPNLGSEEIDEEGVAAVIAWIDTLSAP